MKNIVTKEYYENGDSLVERTLFAYNNKGNRIKEIYYHPINTIVSITTFKYDKIGNKVEKAYDQRGRGSLSFLEITRYDATGNEIQQTRYSKGGKLIWSEKHKYSYDNTQNWIKEIYFTYLNQILITERLIKYYHSLPKNLN